MEREELKKHRKKLFGTQACLARVLNVRRETIADWERGASAIPRSVALLLLVWGKYPEEATIAATDSMLPRP